ncbi:MAG: RrF2 family transcriptional regulator [Pirellulales bacterium]
MPSLVRISEAASLALHTMAILAKNHARRLTTQEISAVLGGSPHHLAKVMQRLARAGLVDSTRGPQGGFRTRRPAAEVSLLEIYEAVDGPLGEARCLLAEPICDGKDCVLGELVQAVHRQVRNYLERTTLAELAADVRILKQLEVHPVLESGCSDSAIPTRICEGNL